MMNSAENLFPHLPLTSPLHDAIVIDALMRCGISNGTIFSLMWGIGILDEKLFPPELVQIVNNMLEEDAAIKEITDREEKRIRRIILDLDYMIVYEATVDRLVEVIKKKHQQRPHGIRMQ